MWPCILFPNLVTGMLSCAVSVGGRKNNNVCVSARVCVYMLQPSKITIS